MLANKIKRKPVVNVPNEDDKDEPPTDPSRSASPQKECISNVDIKNTGIPVSHNSEHSYGCTSHNQQDPVDIQTNSQLTHSTVEGDHLSYSKEEEDRFLQFMPPGYKYGISSLRFDKSETYIGAHQFPFVAHFSLDVKSLEAAQIWLSEFHCLNKVQYRKTKSPWLGKCVSSQSYHCQHRSRNYFTKVKNKTKRKKLQDHSRNKGKGCNSTLKISIHSGTNKRSKYAQNSCFIDLDFHHSHSISSAYALGFQDIADDTIKKFEDLFEAGHSASSARRLYEMNLQLSTDPERILETLADRAVNPRVSDINNLYQKWKRKEIGPLCGTALLEDLECMIRDYNANHKYQGNTLDKGMDFFVSIHDRVEMEKDHFQASSHCIEDYGSDLFSNLECEEDFQENAGISPSVEHKTDDTLGNLSLVFDDMKRRFDNGNGDPNFVSGLQKFCNSYISTATNGSLCTTSQLASKLHEFGNLPHNLSESVSEARSNAS